MLSIPRIFTEIRPKNVHRIIPSCSRYLNDVIFSLEELLYRDRVVLRHIDLDDSSTTVEVVVLRQASELSFDDVVAE